MPRMQGSTQKAPNRGAFFVAALLAGLLGTPSIGLPQPLGDCRAEHISERARVDHVYDGDTVKLSDGRRVRLIGINTPEVGHDGEVSQPHAQQARAFLKDLLDKHNRVLQLQYGRETRDHYGRLLAHVFLEDGSNVATRLLEKGLATALVVPPNTWAQDCYQAFENAARTAGRGLWALPAYQSQDSTGLSPADRGFRIVFGQVTEIRPARHSLWVDLAGPLVVRIARKDMTNFSAGYLDSLPGKTVEVRGWLKEDKRGLRMNVREPSAIQVISKK